MTRSVQVADHEYYAFLRETVMKLWNNLVIFLKCLGTACVTIEFYASLIDLGLRYYIVLAVLKMSVRSVVICMDNN